MDCDLPPGGLDVLLLSCDAVVTMVLHPELVDIILRLVELE